MSENESRPARLSLGPSEPEGPVELLPLNEALLDDDELVQLLSDIELAADLVQVRLKGAAAAHSVGAPTLADATAGLVGGSVAAVQLCYEYRGQQWIDTLMRTPRGVRLIRAPVPVRG